MKGTIFAVCAALAVALAAPGMAAPPDARDDAITFEKYRDWRLNFTERRRSELAVQLSAGDLPDRQRTRLEETRAYFDWLAGLPEAEQDRRFRERFDRIDANRDGKIDAAERAAWRDKQRAFYNRSKASRDARETAEAR